METNTLNTTPSTDFLNYVVQQLHFNNISKKLFIWHVKFRATPLAVHSAVFVKLAYILSLGAATLIEGTRHTLACDRYLDGRYLFNAYFRSIMLALTGDVKRALSEPYPFELSFELDPSR